MNIIWKYIKNILKKDIYSIQQDISNFDAFTYGQLSKKGIDRIDKEMDLHNKVFIDIGSGDARALTYIAILHPNMKKAIGIELSNGRHNLATKLKNEISKKYKHAPIILKNKSVLDMDLSIADYIWISDTCFPNKLNKQIWKKILTECKKGCIIFSSIKIQSKFIKTITVAQDWNSKTVVNIHKI